MVVDLEYVYISLIRASLTWAKCLDFAIQFLSLMTFFFSNLVLFGPLPFCYWFSGNLPSINFIVLYAWDSFSLGFSYVHPSPQFHFYRCSPPTLAFTHYLSLSQPSLSRKNPSPLPFVLHIPLSSLSFLFSFFLALVPYTFNSSLSLFSILSVSPSFSIHVFPLSPPNPWLLPSWCSLVSYPIFSLSTLSFILLLLSDLSLFLFDCFSCLICIFFICFCSHNFPHFHTGEMDTHSRGFLEIKRVYIRPQLLTWVHMRIHWSFVRRHKGIWFHIRIPKVISGHVRSWRVTLSQIMKSHKMT